MTHLITSPEKFADEFNAKVPGAYRPISADDVKDMVACGLIGKFDYFLNLDIETVRAILQYEQLRETRQKRDEIRDSQDLVHCRRCGVVLVPKPKAKLGRPNEYCADCERFRGRERYRKWRGRQRVMTMS